MDIYEMLEKSGYSARTFDKGQHYCAAVIHNAGVADYDTACEAYLEAGGSQTNWH